MDTFKTSFLQLLQDISEATSRREQSETDYQDLLRNIFKKGDQYDASRWEAPSRLGYLLQKDFKKEGRHNSPTRLATLTLRFREDDLLPMISREDGLHAVPEVDLPILESGRVLGREHEMTKLLLKCCNPDEEGNQLSAIPIVGAAGIGKTALARLLYEDELVLRHFEMRVWVKVDGLELSLHHAAQQILKSAMHMSCSIDDLTELDEMVRDTLLGRRCLIVFDGVESMTQDVWLHMNDYWFSYVDLGSIVLITTPSVDVAYLVSNVPFELKKLLLVDGGSMYIGTPTDLEALCGNIPLLLKLVGSMMRYDDKLSLLLSAVLDTDAISLPTFDASVSILLCVWAFLLN